MTTGIDMNGGIKRRIDKAIADYDALVASFRKQASGAPIERTDGTTYKLDWENAITYNVDALSKAKGAANLAQTVYRVAQESESAPTLYDAAQRVVEHSMERLNSGTRHGDPIRQAMLEREMEGWRDLLHELVFEIQWAEKKRDERTAKEAAKFAELVDADGNWSGDDDSILGQLRSGVLLVLTDPKLRASLDPQALAQLHDPFGYSSEYVTRTVEQEEAAVEEARKLENAKATAERVKREAVRCRGRLDGGYHGSRCDKSGRYVVTFSDVPYGVYSGTSGKNPAKAGEEVRMCGTHMNKVCKDWNGRWITGLEKVVDTKSDAVVYEKEAAVA